MGEDRYGIMVMTGDNGDVGGGAHRIAGEPMGQDTDDLDDRDGAAAMTPRGGSREKEVEQECPRAEVELEGGWSKPQLKRWRAGGQQMARKSVEKVVQSPTQVESMCRGSRQG